MNYFGPFFQQFCSDCTYLDPVDFETFDKQANIIALDFYENDYDRQAKIIKKLVKQCNKLYVYNNEPTSDQYSYMDFLLANDHSKIVFLSDVVLNFQLKHAKFQTVMCWFIDHINYYNSTNWAKNLLQQLDTNLLKIKKFDCLLGTPKAHRDIVEIFYNKSHFKEDIIYSYFKNDIMKGLWNDVNNPKLLKISLTGDQCLINGEHARASAILPVDIYNQTYYSIVSETTCSNQYSQFTEKVAKPIVSKRPFIVFSGQFYLRNLRSLGFKTFEPIINESYDSIPDDRLRFHMAWSQVEKLCTLDPLTTLEKLQPVLNYNQQHFLQTDWVVSAKKIY